jgi:hypothetical protein
MARLVTKDSINPSAEKATKPSKSAGKNATVKNPNEPAPLPRRGGVRKIGELSPDIGRAAFRRFGFVQSSIVTRWPEIVGERYAKVSQPDMIKFPQGQRADGTLHLTVESAAATIIQHVVPDIIARVNRFFGYAAIVQIRMTHGRIKPATQEPPRAPPNLLPIPVELGESLRDIGDPELRAVLENLAAGLARREKLPKIS